MRGKKTRISVLAIILLLGETFLLTDILDASDTIAGNTLILPRIIYVSPGSASTFGLSLNNTTLITGGQFHFKHTLENFRITKATLTSRTTGYELPILHDVNQLEIQVLLYSLHGAVILPGDGDIITFHYETSSEFATVSSLEFIQDETLLADIQMNAIVPELHDGRVMPRLDSLTATSKSSVPEPSTFALWVIGLLGSFVLLRKKQK